MADAGTVPELTIPALLARHRAERGATRALVMDDTAITYEALDDESRSLAARLVAAGVGPHARVGLLLPNGIEWAVVACAVLRVGGVLVPLSTLLRPPELVAQLQVASVTHLIAAPEHRGRRHLDDLEHEAPGLLSTLVDGGRHTSLPALRCAWTPEAVPIEAAPREVVDALEASVRPADDLAIMFTSGSRGTPKGVVHTHGGALRATAAGLPARCIGPDERLYIPMPFFWMGGFGGGLLSVLIAGATLLTEAAPTPASTLALLERERATLFRGWPDQAARLAADPAFASTDLSSLRDASLGPVLPPERRPAPGARANLFGMTESFGPYCGSRLDLDLPEAARGSCGQPFAGVEVRIVDDEIQLRGPNLMRTITGRLRTEVFTADGWYPTGDLGTLDADGYLWYRGRLDDMFKVKGATVYPSEVEAAIRPLPGVRQVHATDLESEVAVLVVASGDVPLADLVAGAKQRLSSFKVPTRWLLTTDPDTVPMLASAKVDKRALQALLATDAVRP